MSHGNPRLGLLKDIIDEVRRRGSCSTFQTADIAAALIDAGWWDGRDAKTPQNSVNMYCSQNNHIFEWVGPDTYRLKPKWRVGNA